jgi:hypothetical protein
MAFVPLPPINPLMELIPVNVGAESAGQWQVHSATDVRKDRLSTNGPPV